MKLNIHYPLKLGGWRSFISNFVVRVICGIKKFKIKSVFMYISIAEFLVSKRM